MTVDPKLAAITAAAEGVEAARLRLAEAMRQARLAGHSLRPIALAAGMSVESARKITG